MGAEGGRGRVGCGGRWGAEVGLKKPIRLKQQYFVFSMRHKLMQCIRLTKTAVRSSLVPHAVLL